LATTQGCSTTTIFAGYGIPPQLSQNAVTTPPTSVDFCKSLLSTRDAAELQIYFNVYGGNILLDGVHNAQTCPILFWYHYYYGPYAVDSPPTITAAQYAAGMLTFLKNKRDQDLIGKKAECNAALQAAGLPLN
jgi:hypothetical protein